MPDQQIGKVTIKTSSTPSLTTDVGSVKVNVNGQNTQRVGVIQYGGTAGSDTTPLIANLAFDQANNAFYQANLAYEMANSDPSFANGAFDRANSAYDQANAAFEMANSDPSFANAAFITANSAFNQANNSFNVANSAFSQANNSFNVANVAYTQANSSTNTASAAFDRANSAYNTANNAGLYAQPAYNQANNAFNVANLAYAQANIATPAFTQANNSFNVANAAFGQANLSFDQANNAFDSSNNRVLRAGDTMTGLLSFNTTGNTFVGPVQYGPEAGAIDLFSESPTGYAQLNWANTNYVWVDWGGVYGSTSNTSFELNESAKHFKVFVPENKSFELSLQEGFVVNSDATIYGLANVTNKLSVGSGSYTLLPNLIAQFTGISDYYVQINQQNLSGNGSGDVVITADNGTDLVNYIDLGINGSTYINTTPNAFPSSQPNDGYLYLVGNPGANFGGNLVIGTAGSGSFADISFTQGPDFHESVRFIYGNGIRVLHGIQANGIIDGTYNLKDYTSLVYNYANTISYNVSLSYAQANAAFDAANNAGLYAQPAFNQANSAYNVANAAFVQANNSFNVANVAYTQANNGSSFANGAFNRANSAYDQANSAASFANGAFTLANTKYSSSGGTISGDVSVTGNLSVLGTVTTVNTQQLLVRDNIITLDSTIPTNVPAPSIDSGIEINRGLYQNTQLVWSEVSNAWRMSDGNTFSVIASANLTQAAFTQANNSFNVANAAFNQANNSFNVANVAYTQANNAASFANGAFTKANSAGSFANGAFEQANNAASFANSAFTKANNALANTTGTFAGDLTVTGNVSTVSNVTANYFVTTGSAGVITGANLIYSNTFIASVGYQFPDGTTQTTAASANIASAAFSQANNAFNVANAAFNQANNSFNVANVAYIQANNAASFANGAFTQANNAASFANSAYAFANTGYTQANNAASFANGAFVKANSAGSFANGAFDRANSGYDQANSAASFANGSFTQANNAASFANGAFVTANSGFAQANNAFNVANAAFTQANNSFNVANVAYVAANNAGSFANSAYSSANVKARIWESDTPPTANNYDLWLDSSNGVTYLYTTSNGVSTWVEYGPIGTPLSNLGDFTFSDQTMTGSYANQDVTIYQSGTGNIVLHSANTVSGNLIPNTAFLNVGTTGNPWKQVVTSNVTTSNVYVTGSLSVNNSTFLSNDSAVRITGSTGGTVQTPSNDGYMLQITGKDGVPTRTIIDSFGTSAYPLIAGRKGRGTAASPTAVSANDVMLRISSNGWGSTGFAPLGSARIDFVAAENYTDSSRGSRIEFYNVVQGGNTLNKIASFNADSVEFLGTITAGGGFAYTSRSNTSNSATQTIDFSTDSSVRLTMNTNITISFTNYVTGKIVDLICQNLDNNPHNFYHGVTANNSSKGTTYTSIPGNSLLYCRYICYDGDLANTFAVITIG